MREFIREARDFGNSVNENGPVVPVPSVYPQAVERIQGLFEFKEHELQEIERELTGNMMLSQIGHELVKHYPADEHEAAVKACAVEEKFYSQENVSRIYEAIIDSYLGSSQADLGIHLEGPVPPEELPDLSQFES